MFTIDIDPVAFMIGAREIRWYGIIVALAIVAVIHTRLRSYVDEQVLINVDLHLMPPGMVAWLLVGGIGLGLLGSAFSVQRYLRV